MTRRHYLLGVDGGQSHTTALVADASGRIIGVGHGGPSNHTLAPGGRLRLERALAAAVGGALHSAGLAPAGADLRRFAFHSAHLAMTGEPADKVAVVEAVLAARHLVVDHDGPAALAGATGGADGIIVLAGTGSVALGCFRGRTVRIGGRGYIFADQGSAWAIGRDAVARTHFLQERGRAPSGLRDALLRFFRKQAVVDVIEDFYRQSISRDRIAAFSRVVQSRALRGDPVARDIVQGAASDLVEMAAATAARLRAQEAALTVSYGGGVFRGALVLKRFREEVAIRIPEARVVSPIFGPDVGALLLAYRQAGIKVTSSMLAALGGSRGARRARR